MARVGAAIATRMNGRPHDAPTGLPPGSVRWYVWLYAPPEARAFTAALFAIEREITASARPGLDHGVAHARLDWWQGECERIAAGRPVHPLAHTLATPPTSAGQGPDLSGLLENARWDLASAAFETRSELDAYCQRWANSIALALAPPTAGPGAAAFLCRRGAALRETELLVHLAPEARRGRLRLPLDELERLQVDPRSAAHPPWPTPLTALLHQRYEALHGILANRDPPRDHAQPRPALRTMEVWCSLTARLAARALQALPEPAPERARDRFADALVAWRAARRMPLIDTER